MTHFIPLEDLEIRLRQTVQDIPGFSHCSIQMEKCYSIRKGESSESWNVTLFVIIKEKLTTCGPCTNTIQVVAVEDAFHWLGQKLTGSNAKAA